MNKIFLSVCVILNALNLLGYDYYKEGQRLNAEYKVYKINSDNIIQKQKSDMTDKFRRDEEQLKQDQWNNQANLNSMFNTSALQDIADELRLARIAEQNRQQQQIDIENQRRQIEQQQKIDADNERRNQENIKHRDKMYCDLASGKDIREAISTFNNSRKTRIHLVYVGENDKEYVVRWSNKVSSESIPKSKVMEVAKDYAQNNQSKNYDKTELAVAHSRIDKLQSDVERIKAQLYQQQNKTSSSSKTVQPSKTKKTYANATPPAVPVKTSSVPLVNEFKGGVEQERKTYKHPGEVKGMDPDQFDEAAKKQYPEFYKQTK
jgi:hypothetical protein